MNPPCLWTDPHAAVASAPGVSPQPPPSATRRQPGPGPAPLPLGCRPGPRPQSASPAEPEPPHLPVYLPVCGLVPPSAPVQADNGCRRGRTSGLAASPEVVGQLEAAMVELGRNGRAMHCPTLTVATRAQRQVERRPGSGRRRIGDRAVTRAGMADAGLWRQGERIGALLRPAA